MSVPTYRKIVLLGSRAVGKTSLTQHFVREEFPPLYHRSMDNVVGKTFALGLVDYELEIVDTESQVLHSYIPQSYVSGVDGYIVVYSVDSIRSYDIAASMYEKLEIMRGRRRMPILIVANKMDVPATCLSSSRHVTRRDGERLAETWNAPFLEVCAKNLEDCKEVFIRIIEEIDGVRRPPPPPPPPPPSPPTRRKCQLM